MLSSQCKKLKRLLVLQKARTSVMLRRSLVGTCKSCGYIMFKDEIIVKFKFDFLQLHHPKVEQKAHWTILMNDFEVKLDVIPVKIITAEEMAKLPKQQFEMHLSEVAYLTKDKSYVAWFDFFQKEQLWSRQLLKIKLRMSIKNLFLNGRYAEKFWSKLIN